MFNIGLIDRLVLGIQLPITFFRGNAVQTPDRGGGPVTVARRRVVSTTTRPADCGHKASAT